MEKIKKSNWLIGLSSFFIPGLGLYMLDKPQFAVVTLGLLLLLFAVFWFFPSMITWFIFAISHLVQMAYSVALATPLNKGEEPNFPVIKEIPNKFLDFKEVNKTLRPFLGLDENLISAIVGKMGQQVVFAAVSDKNLLIANFSSSESVSNLQRFPKDEIKWVFLKIGEINAKLSIEFENEKTINIAMPKKMVDQSKKIVNEFSGIWEDGNYFLDNMQKFQKEQNGPAVIIASLLLLVLFAVCLYYGDLYSKSVTEELKHTVITVSRIFPIGVSFFVIGWFPFIAYVKQIKRERSITWTNAFLSMSVLPVLFVWLFSLSIFGTFWLTFVSWIKQIPIK